MNQRAAIVLGLSTAAIVSLAIVVGRGLIPLGVAGEWVWSRVHSGPALLDLVLAVIGITLYSGFVTLGVRSLESAGPWKERAWVVALVAAGAFSQIAIQAGAPVALGLTKWISLSIPGSSGYFQLAQSNAMRDPWQFWSRYPEWIQKQDALHIGTHPPGLLLVSRASLGLVDASPGVSRWIGNATPPTVATGFTMLAPQTSRRERNAATLVALLVMVACCVTVVPLYLLARSTMNASRSWAVAAIWPVVPSAILFQPTADTFFPVFSTTALAFATWGGPRRGILCGVVLALGMQFSLVFLPVGLAVALIMMSDRREESLARRLVPVVATGIGFLVTTMGFWGVSGANPWIIWWWNQKNHARFYQEYSRSYRAWVLVNPVELAISIGLPTTIVGAVGVVAKRVPSSVWAVLFVVLVLNLSGKNMSEVARLWLPFMPALIVSAGGGMEWLGARHRTTGALVFLVAIQTLVLQSFIQVVYPI